MSFLVTELIGPVGCLERRPTMPRLQLDPNFCRLGCPVFRNLPMELIHSRRDHGARRSGAQGGSAYPAILGGGQTITSQANESRGRQRWGTSAVEN